MKELLRELVAGEGNPITQTHVAREFLQSRILRALERRNAFPAWAFCGGTALRFLHGIPRWSEDLDFAASAPGIDVRFLDVMRGVKTDLEAEGYSVDVKAKADKTVAGAFVRFRGLLHEIGVSPHASQVFSVKVEIDTNPPADAGCESTVLRRRLDAIDWKKARDDVAPFLSRLSDLATVDRERIAAMLGA